MAVTPIGTLTKDPDEVLDYTIDWSNLLGSDTIATVTWTLTVGITNTTSMYSSQTSTIWLGGGTVGTNYTITCKITTANNRTHERSFQINVVDK